MKLLIHDLSEDIFEGLGLTYNDIQVVGAKESTAHCLGCFGCWFKSPGQCLLKDKLKHIGEAFGKAEEIIILSKSCYGSYSYEIKKVLDRSIAISLPFFTYRNRKIHHLLRYKNHPNLKVYFYGNITEFEKEIAQELIKANGINMGAKDTSLIFVDNIVELQGVVS